MAPAWPPQDHGRYGSFQNPPAAPYWRRAPNFVVSPGGRRAIRGLLKVDRHNTMKRS